MHPRCYVSMRFLALRILLMSRETICERSFGNGTSLHSLLRKLCALTSNCEGESVNCKYPAEWISFHVPGSSGGKRSQRLWQALWPHGSTWMMVFLHFPFPCCPSSISSWSRGCPEFLLGHRSRLSFWMKTSSGFECFVLGAEERNAIAMSHGHFLHFKLLMQLLSDRWGYFVNICLSWASNHLPELHPGMCLWSWMLILRTNSLYKPYWSLPNILTYCWGHLLVPDVLVVYWAIAQMRIWCKKPSLSSAYLFH